MEASVLSIIGFLVCTGVQGTFHEEIDLEKYKQPDDAIEGHYDYLTETELCLRPCDGKPKICYYVFNVELYSSMGPACKNCPNNTADCAGLQCVTADGYERGIQTFNRRLPGPSIQVCKGDTVVVDVINELADGATTIHWHGIRQMKTPFSDGVPKVTQCPILPGNQFRYFYKVTESGTFFYHSHQGLQKVDGLSGSLIVRDKKEDEYYGKLYDYDLPSHVLLMNDWMHIDANQKEPGLQTHDSEQRPDSYLINGRGIFAPKDMDFDMDKKYPPVTEFRVRPGGRYRFRLIGATCLACTVNVKFFGHRVTLIHADGGGNIVPQTVDSITLNSGDRFDVILTANKKVDSYWILARGVGACMNAQQFAVLRYEGHNGPPAGFFPGFQDVAPGKVLNPTNSFCNTSQELCLYQLQSPASLHKRFTGKNEQRVVISFGFYFFDFADLFQSNTYQRFFEPAVPLTIKSLLNNVSHTLPASPLLSQYNDIPKDAFCKPECFTRQIQKACDCLNVIKVRTNAEVTMMIIDTAPYSATGLTHPFHLHGYNFQILEMGVFKNDTVDKTKVLNERLDKGLVKNDCPIEKDTVGIPSGGYAIIKFLADNPGFWFIHCHFAYHLDNGMSLVFQVGELHEMAKVPPNFPKCGNFKPPIKNLL